MDRRTRQQRAGDAASGPRAFSREEEARLKVVALPYVVVSLVLQGLLLVVGIRTVREMLRARHLGLHPLPRPAANRPLVALVVLNLAQIVVGRRVSTWVRRLNASPPD